MRESLPHLRLVIDVDADVNPGVWKVRVIEGGSLRGGHLVQFLIMDTMDQQCDLYSTAKVVRGAFVDMALRAGIHLQEALPLDVAPT